ncbi:helix-turn-helix domain-containing protein [Sphingobium yanoikuyae]|uniref:helix-turn-helix domain-containing protein n=1 Tax=Sphingobium yanoikuyae TaxID=13690 RepID=UPI001F1B042E|nr:helix-turn-helix domain-containing protein [Sphingobium yanoikuyae]
MASPRSVQVLPNGRLAKISKARHWDAQTLRQGTGSVVLHEFRKQKSVFEMPAMGQIFRDERKELGLSQDELAAAGGVGLRFIVELERARRPRRSASSPDGILIALILWSDLHCRSTLTIKKKPDIGRGPKQAKRVRFSRGRGLDTGSRRAV